MAKRAYLFIAHGSREVSAAEGFDILLRGLRKSLPGVRVAGAYLTLNKPSIEDAVEAEIDSGVESFIVVPLFFFEGSHIKNDIPKILADLKLKHDFLDFQVAPPLASIEGFAEWVLEKTASRLP